MFRKLLLIALVCVSVSQVHGNDLKDTINSGLAQARGLFVEAQDRLEEARTDANDKKSHISYESSKFIGNAVNLQESTKQSLRNVANAMEEKAEQNNRPESVFECIRKQEMMANGDIASYLSEFATGMQKLRVYKQENIDKAAEIYDVLGNDLVESFMTTCKEMVHCKNADCVHQVYANYTFHLRNYYEVVKRNGEQISAGLDAFVYEGNTSFSNFERQVSRTKSSGTRNIKMCYYRGGRDLLISEDPEEPQEVEETHKA